jgi:Nif-specific regulatory protein
MGVYLIVTKGPDAPQSHQLAAGLTYIGTDHANQLILRDPYVSRRHCVVDVRDDSAVVTDLGSKNATRVNGNPIQQTPLKPGDRLAVGLTELVFSVKSESVSALREGDAGESAQTTRLEVLGASPWGATLPVTEVAETVKKGLAGTGGGSQVLRAGYQLSRSLAAAQTPEELTRLVLEHLLAVTEADWGALFLARPDGEFEVGGALSGGGHPDEVRYSRSVLQEALSRRSPVLSGEVTRDGRFVSADSVRDGGLRSVLCVPVLGEAEALGALYLVSRSKPFAFAQEEVAWLEAVAGQMAAALERLAIQQRLKEENALLRCQAVLQHGLIGDSTAIHGVLRLIAQIAPTDATVLIRGETGTGKELVSRALHCNSRRKDGPFVCVNCAALPKDLVESELFGYERGAFTGAAQAKPGKFELASGGTIFLDEVGELAPGAQAKLLRVLERQPFERVGGTKSIQADVRVVVATNRDLVRAMEEGLFRGDLYHRLNVISIELPPLRERREDIRQLAEFFLDQLRAEVPRSVGGFSEDALRLMSLYEWPGNVRELRNAVEYALVRGTGAVLEASDLPESIRGQSQKTEAATAGERRADDLREAEKLHILAVYERCGRNKTKAASALGIARDTLFRKLKEFGVK